MREEIKPPTSLFGIRVKSIIFCIIIAASILIVIDPLNIRQLLSPFIPSNVNEQVQPEPQDREIIATPEMISKAVSTLLKERSLEHEATDPVSSADRYFYIIELTNGGDLEADNLTIKPGHVTITAATGVETVIPRNTIKNIRKYKLPSQSPPGNNP